MNRTCIPFHITRGFFAWLQNSPAILSFVFLDWNKNAPLLIAILIPKTLGKKRKMTEFATPNPTDELNTVLFVTQYLCIPIVTLFVLMRFGVRTYYKQTFGIEDGMSLSVMSGTGLC